jgi:SAM-dependent methyltransferase
VWNTVTAQAISQDPLEEVRRRRLIIDRLDAWLYDEIAPYLGRRVLEVGSGHGNLVALLLDRELVVATDVEATSVQLLRQKYADHGHIHACLYDVRELADEQLKAFRVDTVVSLNVLEHIEDDVAALLNMAQLLSGNGCLIVIVPAHQWLYGTMDSAIGHFRRYTKRGLARKLESAGLSIEQQFYLNALGALGWLTNGRLLRQQIPPTGQLSWFNRLVPVLRWAEQRIRPPFGLSLVSVAYQCDARGWSEKSAISIG